MASWPWLSVYQCICPFLFQPISNRLEQQPVSFFFFFFWAEVLQPCEENKGPLQQLQRLYFGKKWLTCSHIWRNPLVDDSQTHLPHKFWKNKH
jgi:hypothetical protein